MSIMLIRLSTGEEVIGDLSRVTATEEGDATVVIIANPCRIDVEVEQTSQMAKMNMTPMAVIYADQTLVLSESHVVYSGQPNENLLAHYNERFVPKSIVVPPEKKIIVS